MTRAKDTPLQKGFSLIEVIGVLAILVILAVVIIPRVASRGGVVRSIGAVNQAAVDQVVANVRALASAATEHRARFGSLASRNGAPFAVSTSFEPYDAVLVSEQLLDQPFRVRLGSGATVRLLNISRGPATIGSGGYDLLGTSARAAYVLEAIIPGLSDNEARALNDVLDGPALGAQPGQDDSRGKVTYRGGDPAQLREVHIYITHE